MATAATAVMESALPVLMAAAAAALTEARPGVAQRPATTASERVQEQYIAVTARMAAAVLAAAAAIIMLSARTLITEAQDHRIRYGHKHLMAQRSVLVPAEVAVVTRIVERRVRALPQAQDMAQAAVAEALGQVVYIALPVVQASSSSHIPLIRRPAPLAPRRSLRSRKLRCASRGLPRPMPQATKSSAAKG